MNDYWLYLSKSEMTVGKTGSRQRKATVLDSAGFQADNLADFVRQRVPRGKRLSIWLSGGHCHYVAFPRPRWVFASGKLHTIAARVFEQKTMQNAADYRLSLKPSRSSLHVCAIRHADVAQILGAVNDRYAVRTVKPLAPEVLNACKRTARATTFVLYEPDSLTIASPGKEAGLLVATTGGASHASVLTRMLTVHAEAPSAIEVISMSSIQTGLAETTTPSPILNGWLKRLEPSQHHGG
ncbi:hypothetical protein [Ralstonia solanacearum]|uniref:hypothetical protein n=1 Tax=Ralstonia solanacearum TaxID=305 RepID=UPI0018D0D2AA|nr:hypothetical protein [Ralstonia solanacearum]